MNREYPRGLIKILLLVESIFNLYISNGYIKIFCDWLQLLK